MTKHLKKLLVSTFCFFVLAPAVYLLFSLYVDSEARANESETLHYLAVLNLLQKQYAQKQQGRFASFDELIKSENLDEHFRGEKPVIKGYVYEMKVSEPTDHKPPFYAINADPTDSGNFYKTGTMRFYLDSTIGSIKSTEENRPATPNDPAM
jgi:hypothetical protein